MGTTAGVKQINMFVTKDGKLFESEEDAGNHSEYLDRREKFITWYNKCDNGLYADCKIHAEEMFEWLEEHKKDLEGLI